MSRSRRVVLEPAFLLHHRDWSDTSRILDFITRGHGRVTLFARGARRPKSPLRPALQLFVPLLVSWSGPGDGGQLTGAELAEGAAPLPPGRLMSGFYLNELLLRLTHHEDAMPDVFDIYARAVEGLRSGDSEQPVLRRFEKALLGCLGYGLELATEAGMGEPIAAERYYHFHAGHGFVRAAETAIEGAFHGEDLLALAADRLDSPATLRAARRLLRESLAYCLDGRGLKSREVMLALRRREAGK